MKVLSILGINPLLGKYIYQCAAVKRVQSHEKTKLELDAREPGDDIDEIFKNYGIDKLHSSMNYI